MKQFFCLALALFFLQDCEGQKAVVANMKLNTAYIEMPNYLRVVVPGYNCDGYEVTTDNGKIEKSKEDCTIYHYYPLKSGIAHIIIKAKKPNGKLIDSIDFRVRHTPAPTSELGGQKGGVLPKARLMMCMGISPVLTADIDTRYIIQKYSVKILRNDKTIFTDTYTDPYFSDGLKEEFKKIKQGDKLLFYEITAYAVNKEVLDLSTMEFTIIE